MRAYENSVTRDRGDVSEMKLCLVELIVEEFSSFLLVSVALFGLQPYKPRGYIRLAGIGADKLLDHSAT